MKTNTFFIKKIFFLFIFSIWTLTSFAQIPQFFNYQAVARDEQGNPIVSKTINIEITIQRGAGCLDEGGSCTDVWQESHQVTTNEFGLFAVLVGNGIRTQNGIFSNWSDIIWTDAEYYLKIRVDFGDSSFGNGLVEMGTIKFQSVPYALVSDTTLHAPIPSLGGLLDVNLNALQDDQVIRWNGTEWIAANAIEEDMFVKVDGTSDLTGDWTISSNNIHLTNGTLTANRVTPSSLMMGGVVITTISTDGTLINNSDATVPTEQAVKTYVDAATAWTNTWFRSGSTVYNENDNIGIGTQTPEDRFHAEIDTKGFLVTGRYDGNVNISNLGASSRFAFYPSRGALRAGVLDNGTSGSFWDNSKVGNYSTAFGRNTLASGDYSTAFGRETETSGNYAVAFGLTNQAVGARSFVSGRDNVTRGPGSVAFGEGNETKGAYAMALGLNTLAAGNSSLALGEETTTNETATGSFAAGYRTFAGGKYSVALGTNTKTDNRAESSFIFGGGDAKTEGNYSVGFGWGVNAVSFAEFVIGRYNTKDLNEANGDTEWKAGDRLFVVGNGTDNFTRQNAFVIMKNGNVGIGTNTSYPTFLLQVGLQGDGTSALANSWGTYSDRRWKKDLQLIPNALEKAKKISGYYYFWKDAKDKTRQVGVIAQEIEKILPELVTTDAKGYKSVDYSKLTALLIEAIKEQQKIIDKLKQSGEKNQQQFQKLNAQFEAMSKRIENIELLLKQ